VNDGDVSPSDSISDKELQEIKERKKAILAKIYELKHM